MKLLAYARSLPGLSVADQVARSETWARRHELLRLVGHELRPDADEYPPRSALLAACEGRVIDGVVVADLAALGPRLAQTLGRLDRCGVRLLVAGDMAGGGGHDLDTNALRFAVAVAKAVVDSNAGQQARPRRVCPPRVHINLDDVRFLQARGATLLDVSRELGVSRSAIVDRLRRERERTSGRVER